MAYRAWAATPGAVKRFQGALRAVGLRARNRTFGPDERPCFAVYEEGDTYVGCVEIGDLGNLRIPPADLARPRGLAKRQRLALEALITAWEALLISA